MSTPTDPSHDDELRLLRARAYGPGADIHDDPEAMARLQQLEARERQPSQPVAEQPEPSAPADDEEVDAAAPTDAQAPAHPLDAYLAATDPTHAHEAVDVHETGDADTARQDGIPPAAAPGEPGPRATPWYRRTPVLWALSLVAAVLLGVGLTLSVQSLTSGKVATLAVDEKGTWPANMGDKPAGGVLFDEFYGMSVVSFSQGFALEPTAICLYIVASSPDASMIGSASCGSGPFPATAALAVTANSPKELRDEYGLGTSLKFVLEGEQVQVFAKAAVVPVPSDTP
ncbi:hypothetical protein IF188_15330 [Microbacterium sp. NEAU-LLC]|uniref:Spermidine/putrescine ABC transporter permease n=1 Tax=Microbacterium helvum TaxID=2773713 RepID=A0ABR8NRK1_9MICO|nr:hypothetical protein [Microbacterium helvum]MBD3943067.1 hypothetical protein [Microbacterium helvum]